MAKVLGLGGFFFKSNDPAASSEWYARVLGLKLEEWGGAIFPPRAQGVSVWSPFATDSTYFDPSTHGVMINFVVDDLDGVLARAESQGVLPLDRNDADDNGRFAWILDPDGFKIELWEPKAAL